MIQIETAETIARSIQYQWNGASHEWWEPLFPQNGIAVRCAYQPRTDS